jgi:hypothetical protein
MSNILKTHNSIHNSPRASMYFPDGHGRDSYIYTNNGGLSKSGYKIVNPGDTHGSMCGIRLASQMYKII